MPRKNHKPPNVPFVLEARAGYEMFSVGDIIAIAQATRVPLSTPCNFDAATTAINDGVQLFSFSKQTVSPPGEVEKWLAEIASKGEEFVSLFGAEGTADRLRAERHFLTRPSAWKTAGFDAPALPDLLRQLKGLIATATAAAEAERARKEGRRRKGSPRQALEHAARLAWRHLTGAPHPTITNKEDAAPTGPFIAFTSAVLREASSRLDQLPAAVERRYAPEAAAAELAAIATKPHAIADWAGKKREMGE